MDYRTRARTSANAIEQLEERRLLSLTLATIQWHGQSIQAIEDSYVVQVKSNVDFNALAAKKGFTDIQDLGGGGFYSFTSTSTPHSLARWGANSNRILAIEPNTPVYASSVPTPTTPAVIPNDTYFQSGDQWDMYNYGQTITNAYGVSLAGTPGADINAPEAWTVSTGSKNVVVAVLDTGVDITHPDLVNNIWTNPTDVANNGLDDDGNGYIDDIHGWNTIDNNNDVNDDNGHGTNVAGIIGAQGNNGIGIAGVNWNISMIPVKVLDANGAGTTASIIAGLRYITNLKNLWISSGGTEGANITAANLSLGGETFPYDTIDARAYQMAGKAGIIIVAAAGNGTNDDGIPVNLDNTFGFPGKYSLNLPNVITVAATDNTGQLSLFSNYGAQSVQIAAPGESIWSTYPIGLNGNQDGYAEMSGTSQATPHVTGVIALMASLEPTATASQLKQALFSSVDVLPSLEGETPLAQPKVTTAGQVDAYKALLAIQNLFLKSDTYTQGNWQGFGAGDTYGTIGAYIAGESTSFPAGVTITGGSTVVYADGTRAADRNAAALQQIADPSQRIEAGQTSATSLDVELNLTSPTRVTLYLADYNNQKRQEKVEVIDPATGDSLSGQYPQIVSNFRDGEYLTYQLTGQVDLRITRQAGPNAILSGVFLDPVIATPVLPAVSSNYANYVSTDTTDQGNWQASFGSQGVYLAGQTANLPPFAMTSISGATLASGGRRKSLLDSVDGNGIDKRYFVSDSEIELSMDFTDDLIHQTTFYAADAKNKHISERIDVVDPSTGNVIATQDISNFKTGAYVSFDLTGQVDVYIIRLAGPNAVLNGIFFDAPPGAPVSYVGVDSTTRGNWMGMYGSAADYIPGESSSTLSLGPDYDGASVTVSVLGATPQVTSTNSRNKSALEISSGPSASRILSNLVSRTNMTINLDFSDGVNHQIAIYLADTSTNNKRTEMVQVSDTATGENVAQQRISNFKQGKYVVFNVRGDATIVVSDITGPNAVVGGVFID
ncbi:MAG TPA: S8 family peptidase [Tepidisphaeraceae bacterium]|nr:S8 family peptidase [Tepidisphaeraceae bacterium]